MKRIKIKRTRAEKKQWRSLYLFFSLITFGIIWVSIIIAALAVWLLLYFDVYPNQTEAVMTNVTSAYSLVLLTSGISLFIGSVVTFAITNLPINPISGLANHINRLAAGDYNSRFDERGTLSKMAAFSPVVDSVNKLAEELQNTEILRGDFINNFSHEFKTPIVSIAGFAKLLRRGNLNNEQREEYLTIIEEESMRLSYMATNVLNLTKIENQAILTDITKFNVSEQIRSSVLLFEEAWTKKDIEIEISLDEYDIFASEELLKQVWINLIDNAIKYSPEHGRVRLDIEEREKMLCVSIANTGEIGEDILPKIWNKFYQGDKSHSSPGNGIGLAIVKRITELHGGEVSVDSRDGMAIFTVTLPRKYKE